jgi:molecular chaperone GrpE
VRKESEELYRFGSLSLARDLLPGLDNLERAIAAAEESGNVEDLLHGIRMVARQFRDALARHSIEPIPAKDEPFDPNLHEAVQQIPSSEHPPMTVMRELETGYRMHDRVIRPAKVLVSAAPPGEDDNRAAS